MSRNEIVADVDLINAVQDSLKRRGFFSKLKAQVRAEVFNVLEDRTVPLPEKPPDVFIAAELIKEFLSLLRLNNTLSVFCEEMGQPRQMAVDRGVIGAELGLNTLSADDSIPLLLLIIEHLKRSRLDYAGLDEASMDGEPDDVSVPGPPPNPIQQLIQQTAPLHRLSEPPPRASETRQPINNAPQTHDQASGDDDEEEYADDYEA